MSGRRARNARKGPQTPVRAPERPSEAPERLRRRVVAIPALPDSENLWQLLDGDGPSPVRCARCGRQRASGSLSEWLDDLEADEASEYPSSIATVVLYGCDVHARQLLVCAACRQVQLEGVQAPTR